MRRFDSYFDIFAQRGGEYHKAMSLWPRARDQEFQALLSLARPAPGAVVLDMPSGGGYLRDHLPDGVEMIAVDPVPVFVGGCETRGIRRIHAPLHAVPLDGGCAHLVLSMAGLHHETDKRRVFREMVRLLRPGGRVHIADVAAGSPMDGFLNGFVDRHNSLGHRGVFIDQQFREDLREAGLRITDDRTVCYDWRFPDAAAMVTYCTLLFGLDRATPQQVADGLARHCGWHIDAQGCALAWQLCFITAEKTDD